MLRRLNQVRAASASSFETLEPKITSVVPSCLFGVRLWNQISLWIVFTRAAFKGSRDLTPEARPPIFNHCCSDRRKYHA